MALIYSWCPLFKAIQKGVLRNSKACCKKKQYCTGWDWNTDTTDIRTQMETLVSLMCPYFRQSELRTPFDSTPYQWLKYGHISDTSMSVCVRMSVVSVFQSHPFQVLTKIIFLRHSHIHSTLTRYTIEISYGKL